MRPRQSMPRRWFIIADQADPVALASKLQRGSGMLLLRFPPAREMRRLRNIARQRDLTLVQEHFRSAVRVHDIRELRRAMLRRTPLVLLSPIHKTASHPAWKPLGRMRAAALARLGGRELIALGGMDARKFARIERLGFAGWAGISAFRT